MQNKQHKKTAQSYDSFYYIIIVYNYIIKKRKKKIERQPFLKNTHCAESVREVGWEFLLTDAEKMNR